MGTAISKSFSLNTVKQNLRLSADIMPGPDVEAFQRARYVAKSLSSPPLSAALRAMPSYDLEGRAVGVGPLLVFKGSQGRVDDEPVERDFNYKIPAKEVNLAVTKCKCSSSWCPECFLLRSAKNIKSHLSEMDFKRVRFIMLSVDRSRYSSGEEAYRSITGRKAIAGFIRNLNRFAGKGIRRWQWVLEWHKDGFPHWHVACEVSETGKGGKIGHAEIMKYWGEGHARESYVKSQSHWAEIAGYYASAGYFDDAKGYQSILPDWALSWGRTIRRFGCSAGVWSDSGKKKVSGKTSKRDSSGESVGVLERPRRTYAVILKSCGDSTKIRVVSDSGRYVNYQWVACIPYKQAVKDLAPKGFGYFKGVGMLKVCSYQHFREIMAYFRTFGLKGRWNHDGIESYS